MPLDSEKDMLEYLKRHCDSKIIKRDHLLMSEAEHNSVYSEISGLIESYYEDYHHG